MVKRSLYMIGIVLGAAVLFIGGFLAYTTWTDYKPAAIEPLEVHRNTDSMLRQGESLTITTFNIGYAGMDQHQDFFMDGGKMSRSSSEAQTWTNLGAVTSFMKQAQSDMYIIQEVDKKSSRSYKMNQLEYITSELHDYSYTYADTYRVPWVPVPIFDPMGSTHSGMLTLSAYQSTMNQRYDLPGKESWPIQLFELDRAFIESRYPVDNGKELVLINLHLSAFDEGGSIRKQQLDYLSSYIDKEMSKGSYLIIGGDWNHSLPDTDPRIFPAEQEWPYWLYEFPKQFHPEMNWAVDKHTSSVRTVDTPFMPGYNFLAVIDGFLVSPNVEIVDVQGADLRFEHSDHNPVTAQFRLR